jgi:hypothetical protein
LAVGDAGPGGGGSQVSGLEVSGRDEPAGPLGVVGLNHYQFGRENGAEIYELAAGMSSTK